VRVRYVGAHPITFTAYGIGSVEPGDEFEVPDEVATAFTSRTDLEKVDDAPSVKPTRGRKPATETVAVTTEPAEGTSGVPDDH
jgi:hypothetical protein